MAPTEKSVTPIDIGAEGHDGGLIWICWTEMVPGPLHWTVTGFAVGDPMMVPPPVTLQRNVYPAPEGEAVYWYGVPAHAAAGPVVGVAGGTEITKAVVLSTGVQNCPGVRERPLTVGVRRGDRH